MISQSPSGHSTAWLMWLVKYFFFQMHGQPRSPVSDSCNYILRPRPNEPEETDKAHEKGQFLTVCFGTSSAFLCAVLTEDQISIWVHGDSIPLVKLALKVNDDNQ